MYHSFVRTNYSDLMMLTSIQIDVSTTGRDVKGDNAMTDGLSMQDFRDIADRLRAGTDASRVTVRFDCERLHLELETVAAESCVDGVLAMEGQVTPGARTSAAVSWLRENRRTFVMEDCSKPWSPHVAPEDYVIGLYGIRSEMLAGVFRDEELVGVVSVHYADGPRTWSNAEVAMIERACEEVMALLEQLDGD